MLKNYSGILKQVRFIHITVISSCILGLTLTTYAAASQPTSPDATISTPKSLPTGYIECPKVENLHKDLKKKTWGNKHGWKSYETSFANDISTFLGAQWQGVKIGNISCLYKSKEGLTFPIILHYSRLVYEPSGKNWGKNLGGYMNCKSHQQKDCIFKPKAKLKTNDIYKEASMLKDDAPQQLGF